MMTERAHLCMRDVRNEAGTSTTWGICIPIQRWGNSSSSFFILYNNHTTTLSQQAFVKLIFAVDCLSLVPAIN